MGFPGSSGFSAFGLVSHVGFGLIYKRVLVYPCAGNPIQVYWNAAWTQAFCGALHTGYCSHAFFPKGVQDLALFSAGSSGPPIEFIKDNVLSILTRKGAYLVDFARQVLNCTLHH